MRCRHPHSQVCLHLVEHRHCSACHEIVPLGPAKVDGEHTVAVAMEMRAVQLATAVALGGRHDATEDEAKGWDAWLGSWHSHGTTYDIDDCAWHPVNAAEETGWLAREILEARRSP